MHWLQKLLLLVVVVVMQVVFHHPSKPLMLLLAVTTASYTWALLALGRPCIQVREGAVAVFA